MKTLKLIKYITCCVLCSSLLSACDDKPTVLSLGDTTQQEDAPLFSSPPSIWAEMGDRFELVHERDRPEVAAQIAFLQSHQDFLYKTLESSAPYMSYIYEETKKRGLPAELALLPIVESEFNPNALSKAGASGLWQLMPGTATELGLKRNRAYDGRKDVAASTGAALSYLHELHQAFSGDWLLALAAYNNGPGHLQTAVKRGEKWYKSATFWHLKLPQETKKYIPKVLALAAVIQHPARYGIKLPPLSSAPKVALVKVHSSSELDTVIEASGSSKETLRRLNPGYKQLATAEGAPNNFLIPIPEKQLASVAPKYAAPISSAPNGGMLKTMLKEGAWLTVALMASDGMIERG